MRALSIFIGIFLSFFFSLFAVHAACDLSDTNAVSFLQGCNPGQNSVSYNGGTGPEAINALLQSVGEKVIAFGALFAIGAIVFSGIRYTTSYGDEEKIKKAKSTAIYALIGLVLLGTAFPFIDVIVSFIYNLGQ